MTAHTLPPETVEDLRRELENPAKIVYVTFGTEGSGQWKRAKSFFGPFAGVETFLTASPADLEVVSWTADRRNLDGTPLGDHAPKGVFFNHDATVAFVLTGEAAKSRTWLRKGYKLAEEAR